MESATAVYTSEPIPQFPVSSLGLARPSRLKPAVGTKGELFQNQIIQRAIWFLSRAVLKKRFDVGWPGDEHNGKVCAALLSLWHCVFKTVAFFGGILLRHSGSLRDGTGLTKCIVGLWEPGIWLVCFVTFYFKSVVDDMFLLWWIYDSLKVSTTVLQS